MPVSLPKGANVSLSKQAPGLKDIVIGLGWDVRATAQGSDFDLDASVFMLKEDGKVRSDSDFVFYNNRTSPEGSVEHLGDDLTGAGDDQRIKVDLDRMPSEVTKLSVAVTIYKAEPRKQDFGMVSNAYIRVLNGANGGEIARYDLSEEASTERTMIFGEVYRRGGEWKFRAVGQGFARGLIPLAHNYGVKNVLTTRRSGPSPSQSPNPPEPARTEEPPRMPRGPLTYTGRYPGYEPAQAMEAFFSVSCEHERPSYEERRDGWVFDGGGYWIVVGCFVEPDGTPVIAVTCVYESDDGISRSHQTFMGEFFCAMKQSAHSTNAVLPDEEITESGESGTLRQLRPSEIHSGAPNHVKDFILGAADHLYPGLWEEFWPDFAACFVSEGEGVVVTYPGEHCIVATIVLTDLQISDELLEGLTEVNVGLPLGSVFLSRVETSWCAVWKYKLLGDWLDPSSQVSKQMALDVLNNAPNMTWMARETLQAKKCGGRPLAVDPEEPSASWAFVPFSHV